MTKLIIDMTPEERAHMYEQEYGMTETEAAAVTTPLKQFYQNKEAVAFALEAREKITQHHDAVKTGEWRKEYKHEW